MTKQTALTPRQATNALMLEKRANISAAIPSSLRDQITFEMVQTSFNMAIEDNPGIAQCDPRTTYKAVMEIVSLGLIPNHNGQAFLIPYKGKCTAIIGALGKIELAYRSGKIDSIRVNVVREGENFRMDLARGKLTHTIDFSGKVGKIIGAYAKIKLKDSRESIIEAMYIEDFETIRKSSKSPNSPAYKNYYGEMFRRSVLNRALKRAPKSSQLADAMAREDGTGALCQDEDDLDGLFEAEAELPMDERSAVGL